MARNKVKKKWRKKNVKKDLQDVEKEGVGVPGVKKCGGVFEDIDKKEARNHV